MSVAEGHAAVVDKLSLLNRQLPEGFYASTQQPIRLLPDSVPEPDGYIVRGEPDHYLENHPTPADISCVIEVADSSLQIDRTTKLHLHAGAGIAQYVIINLVERIVEDYRGPSIGEGRYATVTRLRPGQILSLLLPNGLTLEVPVERLIGVV